MTKHKIAKLVKVGDTIYSAKDGRPMVVTAVRSYGLETAEDVFFFDEVRKLFFLTSYGYRQAKEEGNE